VYLQNLRSDEAKPPQFDGIALIPDSLDLFFCGLARPVQVAEAHKLACKFVLGLFHTR